VERGAADDLMAVTHKMRPRANEQTLTFFHMLLPHDDPAMLGTPFIGISSFPVRVF
jgi:hypothetical protein